MRIKKSHSVMPSKLLLLFVVFISDFTLKSEAAIAEDNSELMSHSDVLQRGKVVTPLVPLSKEKGRSLESEGQKKKSFDMSSSDSLPSAEQSIVTLKQSIVSLQQAAASLQQAAVSLQKATELSAVDTVAAAPLLVNEHLNNRDMVEGLKPLLNQPKQPTSDVVSSASSSDAIKPSAPNAAGEALIGDVPFNKNDNKIITVQGVVHRGSGDVRSEDFAMPAPQKINPSSEVVSEGKSIGTMENVQSSSVENNTDNNLFDTLAVKKEPMFNALEPASAGFVENSVHAHEGGAVSGRTSLELPGDSKNISRESSASGDSLAVSYRLLTHDDTKENPALTGHYSFNKFLAASNGIISLNVSKYAQEANLLEPIRLDEAVAFALKNNFEVKASASRTESAALEKMTAYSRMLPKIEVKLSQGNERSMPASYNDAFGNRTLDDKHNRKDRSFALVQPLIDLEVIADILTNINKEGLAKIQEIEDRDTVVYNTLNVYLKLLQSRISIELADQYSAHLKDLEVRMEKRLEGGGATVGDLERIKANVSSADVARAEALGEYEASLAEFRRLTQITPSQLYVSEVFAPAIPDSITDAVQAAYGKNPSYLASQEKLNIANSTLNSSIAKIAPKVSLEYSDTYAYNAGGAAKGNPVDGVYPEQQDQRLLLVARWQLNAGIEVGAGLTANEKKKEAHFRSLDTRSRLEEGVRASYNAINAANQRIAILQKGVESNEKVVGEFEDQYKNGSRSIFELLDAHGQLYNSRVNLMRVEIAKILAAYQVRRQMGELLPSLIEQKRIGIKEN